MGMGAGAEMAHPGGILVWGWAAGPMQPVRPLLAFDLALRLAWLPCALTPCMHAHVQVEVRREDTGEVVYRDHMGCQVGAWAHGQGQAGR